MITTRSVMKSMHCSRLTSSPRSIIAQSLTSGWRGNCSRRRWKCFGSSWNGGKGEYRPNGSAAAAPFITPAKERAPSKPFSEVAALYFKEHKRAPKTDEQIQSGFRKFLVIIGGDKPISDITKADCRQYKETLLKSVGIATANKDLHNLSHLWNWASGQGFVVDGTPSPVAGLLINKRLAKKERLERKPFTDSDLAAIMGHKEFLSQRKDRPERYWLVLCLLLSGERREEIAQLSVADIQHKDGIHYFDITNEGESQTLKNQVASGGCLSTRSYCA